jgi:hypothetical protein
MERILFCVLVIVLSVLGSKTHRVVVFVVEVVPALLARQLESAGQINQGFDKFEGNLLEGRNTGERQSLLKHASRIPQACWLVVVDGVGESTHSVARV